MRDRELYGFILLILIVFFLGLVIGVFVCKIAEKKGGGNNVVEMDMNEKGEISIVTLTKKHPATVRLYEFDWKGYHYTCVQMDYHLVAGGGLFCFREKYM